MFADERFDGVPEKVIRTTPKDISDPESDFNDVLESEVPENGTLECDAFTGAEEPPAHYGATSESASGAFDENDENKSVNIMSTASP